MPPSQTEWVHLSPYWQPVITQWEVFILRHARNENLDPDLVAAIIMQESQGNPESRSAVGAVGLMQVMPNEAGFVDRPSSQELADPDVNLDMGTAVLTQVLGDVRGDLLTALAAYHGGWRQIAYHRSRAYALAVITLYARAVAARNGYDESELNTWGLVIAVQGRDDADIAASPVPGWLITSHLGEPRIGSVQSAIGAVIYTDADEFGHPWRVMLWLLPNRPAPRPSESP
jgi:hypothetical protein